MTTIKVYDDEFEENYIEVMNADPIVDEDPKRIELNICLTDLDDIYSFFLSREDAQKLAKYLQEQLQF